MKLTRKSWWSLVTVCVVLVLAACDDRAFRAVGS